MPFGSLSPPAFFRNTLWVSYATTNDIAYYNEGTLARSDDYQKKQCKLDVYYPTDSKGFATVVWFHGGGLRGGSRYFPELKNQGIALVAVSYRLSSTGQMPSFLEDSAAATAWVLRNIAQFGGDSTKVFVAGHSAGGYLAAMIGMDAKWLAAHGLSNQQLAGIIPVSAQVSTHSTLKSLRGNTGPQLRPIVDEYAPLFHASKDLPPICLIVGGRKLELASRVAENELLAVTLRNLGHPHIEFYEMGGLNHGSVATGGMIVAHEFLHNVLKMRKARE